MTTSPIIIALDYPTAEQAFAFVQSIDPKMARLKVGLQLFMVAGPAIVQTLQQKGFEVFLDLKYHDIPNTVQQAVSAAKTLGAWMLNVHALGGSTMLRAAKEGLGQSQTLLIAVTVLTSMDAKAVAALGLSGSIEEVALRLAQLTADAGLDGVVCSAHEVAAIKKHFGPDFKCITPGIRLASLGDDQKRVVTPVQAKAMGSDYCVIGRPITAADNPNSVLTEIYQELCS